MTVLSTLDPNLTPAQHAYQRLDYLYERILAIARPYTPEDQAAVTSWENEIFRIHQLYSPTNYLIHQVHHLTFKVTLPTSFS
jgi:hypothetical protein